MAKSLKTLLLVTIFVLGPIALASPLTDQLNEASQKDQTTILLKVGTGTLNLTGKIMFVSPKELPDFFGLMDERNVLHLLKADPELIAIAQEVRTGTRTGRPINHLLVSREDFSKVHANVDGSQEFHRNQGYNEMVNREIVPASRHAMMTKFGLWAASGIGTMLYYSTLDSAFHGMYLGRVGPRIIMDHFSNFIGSVALVSQGFVFAPPNPTLNKVWRIFLASGATAANFAIENPTGIETLKMFSEKNVQDPMDFLAGATAAWLTAMTPEILNRYDHIQARVRGFFQNKRCEELLRTQGSKSSGQAAGDGPTE